MITTITHAAKECALTEGDLVSLLRIAYLASHKVRPKTPTSTSRDAYSHAERTEELYRSPMHTVSTGQVLDPAEQVAPESVLGPTTYARLLTVLAQRKTLEIISKWKQLPKGSLVNFTCLEQVQQATRPETIRHFLGLATRRITGSSDKGKTRIKDHDEDHARSAFMDGAELGAALVAFDNATNSVYGASMVGARKEQVRQT